MKNFLGFVVILLFLLTGCARASEMPIEISKEPVETESEQTQNLYENPTTLPTFTPTLIPSPTLIPILTATPTPTSTPTPTLTPTPVPDTEAPVLTLYGETYIEVIARSEYIEPGYSATDDFDGDITELVDVSGEIDINLCGSYAFCYEVSDRAGNITKIERTVVVKQPETIIPEGKVIYLTFDDGPGKYTNDILGILNKYNIKATFFTCGNGQPKMVTKIHEQGHTVGIHCRSHDYNVVYASEEAYFEDLFAMQNLIYECTGIMTTLVRFPGGSSNKVSSFNPGIMSRLTEQLEQKGFQYFDWNVSSGDSGAKDTEKILNNMISGVKKRNWSIVLQHPETKEYSMKALEQFIVWAQENGYTFLTLDNTSPGAHHSVNN